MTDGEMAALKEAATSSETKTVAAKVKADKVAKKAKKTASKPSVKAKAKATKAAPRKATKAEKEAAHERAISALADKASSTEVKAKGSITEKLQQSTALFFVTYRKKNNLTCAQLAAKLKLDPSAVSHMESGHRSLLRLDSIVEYAKAMAIKPEQMVSSIFSAALS
jgi:ribosome-binding protein aMBF1 (putative translation factor)